MKWGSVTRGAKVGDVVAQLTDNSSRGVLIVGGHGSGKTWMLGQVLAALGSRAVTIRLSPSKALSSIPFGAVNARVGIDLVRSGDYYEVLNGLLNQITEGFTRAKHVLLMVDNGEYLDEQSAAVIMQVIMSSEAKLIVVDKPGRPNAFLRELWRDGQLARFELKELRTKDVQLFLEGVLDGSVATGTAEYLASRSEGNPLVLKGLVSGALEEGSLHKVDGVWVLGRPSDSLGAEAMDYLRMDLEYLSEESRKVVELIALAGPLPIDVLLDFAGAEVLDFLQQTETLVVGPGPVMALQLSRAATAKPIRSLVPVGRSRQLFSEVSGLFTVGLDAAPELLINMTRWAIECGLPVEEAQIVRAAHHASHLVRITDVVLFGKQQLGPDFAAELLALTSMAERSNNLFNRAKASAREALELAKQPYIGALALQAIHTAFMADLDYKEQFLAAFDTFEKKFGKVTLTATTERSHVEAYSLFAQAELYWGDVDSARLKLEALLEHPLVDGAVGKTVLKSLMCEALSILGRTRLAAKIAFEVVYELESPHGFARPDLGMLAYARAVSAIIYDSDWASVQAALAPETFTNPDLMLASGGMKHLGIALMHSRRGFIEEALSQLVPAVAELSDYDPFNLLPTSLALLAYCKVLHGDVQGAQPPLERLDKLVTNSPKLYEVETRAFAAAARAMSGERDVGVSALEALDQECIANSYDGSELVVLAMLIRVGETSAATRLEEVAKDIDCSIKDFYSLWAQALISQDAAMFEKAGAMAVERGYELIAVELAAHAQRKFYDRGEVHRGRKTATKVVTMRESIPGIASPIFASVGRSQMTRRENEIAVLVARGESNNEIASRLNVSLRTVEGHLYRTFIKLDLHSREELADLINDPPSSNPWAVNDSTLGERLHD